MENRDTLAFPEGTIELSSAEKEAAPRTRRATSPKSPDVMSEEADVEIVGWKGDNPLADYPHARFHCAKVPFSGAAETTYEMVMSPCPLFSTRLCKNNDCYRLCVRVYVA